MSDGEGMPTEREWLEGPPEDRDAASAWSAMELEEHLEQLAEARDHLRGECPMCAEISRRLHFAGPPQSRIEADRD